MRPSSHSVAINPYPGKGEVVVLFGGNAQTAPNHRVGLQVLDYHLVHYVVSGKGSFQCLGREYKLHAGDSFFIFPGELAGYASDDKDPWNYRWIGFKGTHVDQILSNIGISAHRPTIGPNANRRIPVLYHQIQQTLQQADPNCDLQAGAYIRLLLAEYSANRIDPQISRENAPSEIELQIERAIRWLTLQYSQPISIEDMAQTLGYHRTHLSKMFKQHTGVSPMNFLLKIRMERAKLLLNQPLTIEQIASSVGFSDALYFSKQFKKWYGCSPTDYRNSTQGKDRFDCSRV
jgi:AraC-like DNA-binding protein